MIKLISIDLDGTTLNKEHKISDNNLRALRMAMAIGVKVVVNTGRHYTAAKDIAELIGSNMPLISNNGARVTDFESGAVLFKSPLSTHQVQMMAQECRRQGWPCAASLNSIVYTDVMPEVAKKWREDGYPIEIHMLGENFYDGTQEADSMLVMLPEPDIYVAQDHLRGMFGDEMRVAVSMPPCMDIMSIAAGKGKTLIWLAEQYGIKRDEIMSIGDSFNDIDMLEASGLAVAVANAQDALKENAHYITNHHEDDGVAAAIDKYVLGDK